ncbi:polyhydroxyalkanoate synthesis repressor PhaR [Parapedomonas caeni]
MVDTAQQTPPVIIKKYANRRLYNTESSSYITLDHLAQMVRDNREFKVVDAKSGDDITRNVLTQIIVEEESQGQNMLPVPFLRQLISMYGDNLQSMVPQYLEASMEAFRRNQEQFRKALEGAFGQGAFTPGSFNPASFTPGSFGPFEQLAKQNMAMFEAATGMFTGRGGKPGKSGEKPAEAAPSSGNDELAELKAQMAELQSKLEKMSPR